MDNISAHQNGPNSQRDPEMDDLDPDASETNPVANDIDPDAEDLAVDNYPERDPAADDWEASSASGESDDDDDLGFDPESPDVSDPQVDPTHPAIVPGDIQDPDRKKNRDSAYDPLDNLRP